MTLIKDIVTLKQVLGGVQKNTNWITFEPFVRKAEYEQIVKSIGEDFYNELVAYVGADSTVKALIERLRNAAGFYALGIATPQLVVGLGDSGATTNTQGGNTAIAKWMYVELRDSAIDQADSAMEDALQYLEKNEATFETWQGSEAYTISRNLFIHSATELTKYFPHTKNSRRMYLALRDYLIKQEEYFIRPLIGDEFFDYLKSKLVDANHVWSDAEKKVLELLKHALANKAFSDCLPFLNMNKDFRLVTETDGVRNEDPASQGRRDGIKAQCDDNAKLFSNKLKAYMDSVASGTVLPTYFASSAYTVSKANKSYERKPIDRHKPYVSI